MSLSTIKSFQNGIALHLDPNADFEAVLEDIGLKFEESRKFFKNAKVALSIEDRTVNDDEEKRIVTTINEHSDIELMCIVGKNEETNRKYIKALKRMENEHSENNAKIYVGNIAEGDIVEAENTLIVYGNVELGGAAAAKGDVIIIGSVFGQVYAGMSGNNDSIIICFGANPHTISIANTRFSDKIKNGFGKKIKFSPIMFTKRNNKTECVQLDEESLKEILTIKHVKTI